MDVLTDVLAAARMKSGLYGRLELTAPWGLSFDRADPHFYVVTRGTCWLEVEGEGDRVQLGGGDFILLPKGGPHALKDAPATRAIPVEQVFGSCDRARSDAQPGGIVRYGGGGAATTLVAGYFSTEKGTQNLLFASLPSVLHVKGDAGTTVRWLEANLQFVASEMASGEPGFETIVSRLADILVVQAVRAHLAHGGGCKGWLRALVDPQIGRALSLIHEKPEDDWTVESLASKVGMSRSAFAARFSQLVEEPRLRYLTRWRMQKASRLLESSHAGVAEIAKRVGYDAEAAFSKAFKRWIGVAPGAYRRTSESRSHPIFARPAEVLRIPAGPTADLIFSPAPWRAKRVTVRGALPCPFRLAANMPNASGLPTNSAVPGRNLPLVPHPEPLSRGDLELTNRSDPRR